MTPIRLALLDRDGTINRKADDGDYIKSPAELEILDGAAQAIARLNRAGVSVAVVTNQRGVATGKMSAAAVAMVNDQLQVDLATSAARIDAVFVCPHDRDSCRCRKPEPGMLLAALAQFGIAPEKAVMIGDAPSDVEAGRRAGVRTLQLSGETPMESVADLCASDLASAVDLVLRRA